jgi:hypothetical protein
MEDVVVCEELELKRAPEVVDPEVQPATAKLTPHKNKNNFKVLAIDIFHP